MEGLLAIVVLLMLGLGLFLFTGESLGEATTGTTEVITADLAAAGRGEALANGTGCLACHTIDGTTGSGPTWKGLAGSSRPLTNGESVVADDTYLTNSIVDPGAQVISGFDNIMPPDYGDQLSNDEVADLVEYIKSLAS